MPARSMQKPPPPPRGDARRKIQIKPLRETNVGVAQA